MKLRAPIILKSLLNGIEPEYGFANKIMANYEFMTASIKKEDLLHLLMEEPEQSEPSSITTLVENISITNRNDVTIQCINQILNRILSTDLKKITYQDNVYITCILRKLGITDTKEFISNIKNSTEEIKIKEELIKLYQNQSSYVQHTDNTEINQNKEENKQENNLYETILNRLHTMDIAWAVHSYNQYQGMGKSFVSHNELTFAEQKGGFLDLRFMQAKERVIGEKTGIEMIYSNPYEIKQIDGEEVTKETVLSNLLEASIFQMIKSLELSRYSNIKPVALKKVWYDIGYEICNTIHNMMERYRYYHQNTIYNADTVSMQNYIKSSNALHQYELKLLKNLQEIKKKEIHNSAGFIQKNVQEQRTEQEMLRFLETEQALPESGLSEQKLPESRLLEQTLPELTEEIPDTVSLTRQLDEMNRKNLTTVERTEKLSGKTELMSNRTELLSKRMEQVVKNIESVYKRENDNQDKTISENVYENRKSDRINEASNGSERIERVQKLENSGIIEKIQAIENLTKLQSLYNRIFQTEIKETFSSKEEQYNSILKDFNTWINDIMMMSEENKNQQLIQNKEMFQSTQLVQAVVEELVSEDAANETKLLQKISGDIKENGKLQEAVTEVIRNISLKSEEKQSDRLESVREISGNAENSINSILENYVSEQNVSEKNISEKNILEQNISEHKNADIIYHKDEYADIVDELLDTGKPEVKQPDIKQSGINQGGISQSGAGQPDISQSGINQSGIFQSELKESILTEVQKTNDSVLSKVQESITEKQSDRLESIREIAGETEKSINSILENNISEQNILEQNISKQNISEHKNADIIYHKDEYTDIINELLDTGKPEVKQPDIKQSGINQGGISQSEAGQPDISQSGISQPGIFQSELKESILTEVQKTNDSVLSKVQESITEKQSDRFEGIREISGKAENSINSILENYVSEQNVSEQNISEQNISEQNISEQNILEQNISEHKNADIIYHKDEYTDIVDDMISAMESNHYNNEWKNQWKNEWKQEVMQTPVEIIYRQDRHGETEQNNYSGNGISNSHVRNIQETNIEHENSVIQTKVHTNEEFVKQETIEKKVGEMKEFVQANIQKEVKNITEQVYQKIEKKLQNERKRRGM